MVTFLTTLLLVSIAGLVSLIVIKRWEMTTGKIILGGIRPGAGRLLGEGLSFVEQGLPAFARRLIRRAYAASRLLLQQTVAWSVLHVERLLEKTLHTLRHTTQERGEGEASAFLREVAEHKKSLLEQSGKERGAIYEE